MNYKAIFFDRDNTLTYKNEKILNKYYKIVEKISKKPYFEDKKKMFEIFDEIKSKGYNTNTYENEVEFYRQYYKQVLVHECQKEDKEIEKTAKQIFELMWLNDRKLFEDVLPTFKQIKKMGLKIGIISDTGHSLQKTLERLGLGEYIDCYTCSKEVGVMKPDPKIYMTALEKLNVSPSECIYVDDYEEEVVGAEKLGIKSFRINRKEKQFNHDVQSLLEILDYIE